MWLYMCCKVSVIGKLCWHGLVRIWWESALVWFGLRLVVGAWYGGMAGKSLAGGCVGMVWYEACGWCMVWWHGW